MIKTIEFKGNVYPKLQSEGNAAKFIIPFAQEVCKGRGYDIGCNRIEWSFPSAIPIDPEVNKDWHAWRLPEKEMDYIFSSHCLEHIPSWVDVLEYWTDHLKQGGVMFLYLPDFSQVYWRAWHNRKHCNMLTPEIMRAYFEDQPDIWENIFVSGIDLNNSFAVMAQKK